MLCQCPSSDTPSRTARRGTACADCGVNDHGLTASPDVTAARDAARAKNAYRTRTPAGLDTILRDQTPRLGLWIDTTSQIPAATVPDILARGWTQARIP